MNKYHAFTCRWAVLGIIVLGIGIIAGDQSMSWHDRQMRESAAAQAVDWRLGGVSFLLGIIALTAIGAFIVCEAFAFWHLRTARVVQSGAMRRHPTARRVSSRGGSK